MASGTSLLIHSTNHCIQKICRNWEVLIWHCLYFMHMDINFIARCRIAQDGRKHLAERTGSVWKDYGHF
ncbi:hypothetical protein BSL78_02706 [Apostichopus japonicus]|uniref:Uncharacterized protein n=1 Tax=Stichopus japonicus TaxID=307972 RepID=A0A2G8LJA6_STIJA|nr:hypothetical protein BSL78_02706 [Apostichopus japonicus]